MPLEERLGACQPRRGDEDVASPPQDEWSSPLSSDPVADLVPDHGPQDAERDDVAQVEVPPLDKDTGGYEDSLARERHPGAFEHHPEEDDQVTVVLDEREDSIHSQRV